MATVNRKQDFFETAEGIELKKKLLQIQSSGLYETSSSYSPNTVLYEDNQRSFVDKHKDYILKHPHMDPNQYIANLQIITRRR